MADSIKSQDRDSLQLSSILQRMSFIEERARILEVANGGMIPSAGDNNATMPKSDSVTTAFSAGASSSVALNSAMTLSPLPQGLFGTRNDVDSSSDYSWRISRPRHRCMYWCSCICHTQRSFRSPWIFNTILGHILVEYVGKGTECNEHSCQQQNAFSSSIKMTYHLPRYVMGRYISAVLEYTAVDGPKVSLRAPRIMDWSHSLFTYANNGDTEAIQALFSANQASPDDVNPRGTSALTYAAAHGHPRLGRFLLENGANSELIDVYGRKPIDLFWERAFSGQFGEEDYHMVRAMFEDTDYVENRHFTVIHKIVLGLIEKDLRSELIHSTATINNLDGQSRTALCWAVIRDDLSSIVTLLEFEADPNIPDHEGNTCLHFARSPAACQSLLDRNANVHARNRQYSRSPLHSFCKRAGTEGMIKHLVQNGIDVNDKDADGETPLLNAIFRRYSSAVRMLIELGADVNAANYSSRDAAIHFAVGFDYHEIISLLLESGADYTATNIRGHTVAHLAARTAGPKTMTILSEAKLKRLDLTIQDEDGKTAADYLVNRKILSKAEMGVHAAFEKLVQSIYADISTQENILTSSRIGLLDKNDIQAQRFPKVCGRPPGAYPTASESQQHSDDELHRKSIASFRCHYQSPCCYIFDAPRGVCSGVISHQSNS